MFSWQIPWQMREREREKRQRQGSERRKDYDGVQRRRTNEESEEKLRKRGTEQKREVSLSRPDVACARPGRTGPINIVETRQINLKLSHVARQKGAG